MIINKKIFIEPHMDSWDMHIYTFPKGNFFRKSPVAFVSPNLKFLSKLIFDPVYSAAIKMRLVRKLSAGAYSVYNKSQYMNSLNYKWELHLFVNWSLGNRPPHLRHQRNATKPYHNTFYLTPDILITFRKKLVKYSKWCNIRQKSTQSVLVDSDVWAPLVNRVG